MMSLIYARTNNFCIGHKGKVPWDLPDEYAHFDELTFGKPVIMGRKSYEDHNSELTGRLNIVISAQVDFCLAANIKLARNVTQAVDMAQKAGNEYFVIGGVNVFIQTINKAQTVYETVIDTTIEGDTTLPEWNFDSWKTKVLIHHAKDEQHMFDFIVYQHRRVIGTTVTTGKNNQIRP